ncbi:hypothetical protein BHM03_00052431 [Ensete ventricosum]|nr:hypothetical protein BHM03_00052431 [Ensete ventricosum]
MLCGLRSLKRVDESWSTNASKKKKKADEKNPYSTRGLDKFAAVLADLGDRRAKIMANAGPQDASTSIWFMYSESSECVPILLRHNDHVSPRPMPPAVGHADDEDVKEVIKEMVAVPEKEVKKRWSWRNWRPSYQWPLVMVLILFCLLMFGRVLAVCCTSIWWYMVPVMQGEGKAQRRWVKKKKKKKKDDRRMGDKSLVVAPFPPTRPRSREVAIGETEIAKHVLGIDARSLVRLQGKRTSSRFTGGLEKQDSAFGGRMSTGCCRAVAVAFLVACGMWPMKCSLQFHNEYCPMEVPSKATFVANVIQEEVPQRHVDLATMSSRPRTTGPLTWPTRRRKSVWRRYGGVSGRTADLAQVRSTPLTCRRTSHRKDDGRGGEVRRHGKQ